LRNVSMRTLGHSMPLTGLFLQCDPLVAGLVKGLENP
jgi:hypothetical protein